MIPALANHAWQSTLCAAVVALVTLALRRYQARTRHALWLVASVKFLVPFSLLIALGSQVQWRTAPPAPSAPLSFAVEEISQPFTAAPSVAPSPAPPVPVSWIPPALTGLWLCGSVAILTRWILRWRRITRTVRTAQSVTCGRAWEALRRVEQAAGIRKPIPLVSSAAPLEPGVFGILRPVLWLPGGIATHLSDTQLDAIIAHELCHIRRRDNLAAAMHMVVEALFWFHPLVWWLGARLVDERERACDEEVLLLGSDPQTYAESILHVCQFCLESPLACVSGITGADLKRRIEAIMMHRISRRLRFAKKVLLAALGVAAIALPISIGLFHTPRIRAQTSAARPQFEVASVKVARPFGSGAYSIGTAAAHGELAMRGTTLKACIQWAYGVKDYQITGPIWLDDERYNILAKAAGPVPESELRLMLQSLLADRFKLAMHRDTKDLPLYALIVGKNGAKIHADTSDGPSRYYPNGKTGITAERISMARLAELLATRVDHAVLDMTGLAGVFNIKLEWVPQDGTEPGPSIFGAVEEQLGLKLQARRAPLEILVIDHAEKTPAENAPAPEAELESEPLTPQAPSPLAEDPHQSGLLAFGATGVAVDSQAAPDSTLSFEAASVKALKSADGPFHFTVLPNRLDVKNMSLGFLIEQAYDLAAHQLSGPDWIFDHHFDVAATSGTPVSQADMRAMLQSLLRERFHLATHWETRIEAAYRLVVLPSGPTMKVAAQGYALGNSPMRDGNSLQLTGPMSMRQLADRLTRFAGKPVLDATNLEGYFTIALTFASDDYDASRDSGVAPPLLTRAVEEQLGLRLMPGKEPIKILVVDHAEAVPTPN